MNPTLKIDPEFEGKCPALTTEEFAQLLENILEEGAILMPLIIWDGVIIDGHNRYKIALEHPEIEFQTYEKQFANRYEALAWICKNQLGRRNLTDWQKKYLIGERYEAEKQAESFHGNQHTSFNESGGDQFGHHHANVKTRKRIANETGTSEGYVMRASQFSKGVNAAEEVLPGMKKDLLLGKIKAREPDVIAIAKASPEQRREIVEELRMPKESPAKSRDSPNSSQKPAFSTAPSRTEVIRTNQSIDTIYAGLRDGSRHANADSMLGTIRGAVGDAIRTCEMVFKEFPQVRQEKAYLAKTVEILQELKNYIHEIEVELNEL